MDKKLNERLTAIEKKTDRNYLAITRLKGRVVLISGAVSILMFLASLMVKERFTQIDHHPEHPKVEVLRQGFPISPMEKDRGRCPLPNNGRYPCQGVIGTHI